jgi:eukaryotic-like serine/threonine-protein kinase
MEDRRSDRFGRYEILSELGRGAMGIVYKARDPKINRVVAVKTISLAGQSAEEELEFRERFFREAEAAGRLSHPGIVTIFDVGEEPETRAPYIVMEYVGGQSLDRLLQSRADHKLPVETALQLALELAEALDCAHGQGVVHRDLKPANVLLTPEGKAKIADFGVAKLNFGNITLAGRALGTPAYMSPEQVNGDPVDGRSDLFSLGVILYTILTGHRPFQGNSAITISYKVVNRDPVPATILDAELPQGLDYIITRAMAKDPAQRYTRGMEIVLDIQHLRNGQEPWSKAKAPAPPAGAIAGQAAKEKSSRTRPANPRPPAANPTRPVPAQSSPNLNDRLNQMRELTRKTLTVGVFCLVAAFAYGLWVISLGPGAIRKRASAPPPPPTAQVIPAPVRPTAAQVIDSIVAGPATTVTASDSSAASSSVTTDLQTPKVAKPATAKKTSKPVTRFTQIAPPETTVNLNHSAIPGAASYAPSPAMLEIEVDHKFAEAKLSVWVDDHLTYTHQLEGTDKKHLVVFHHVQGHELHAMQVSPGNHHLRVQVTSDPVGYDQSATVTGEFSSKQDTLLQVRFDKHGDLTLILQ